VEHRFNIAPEKVRHSDDVDGERVDQHDAIGPRDLNQGERWEVGALPMELRVDRVTLNARQFIKDGLEGDLVVDPLVGRRGHDSPEATGRPEATQAMIPPSTLSASIPCEATNSHAAIDRPPERHIT